MYTTVVYPHHQNLVVNVSWEFVCWLVWYITNQVWVVVVGYLYGLPHSLHDILYSSLVVLWQSAQKTENQLTWNWRNLNFISLGPVRIECAGMLACVEVGDTQNVQHNWWIYLCLDRILIGDNSVISFYWFLCSAHNFTRWQTCARCAGMLFSVRVTVFNFYKQSWCIFLPNNPA